MSLIADSLTVTVASALDITELETAATELFRISLERDMNIKGFIYLSRVGEYRLPYSIFLISNFLNEKSKKICGERLPL